jgi:chitin synthase
MVVHKNCAGCFWEIKPLNPSIFSIVENKLSYIFDKALESVFGFISVLPGAFSAYLWFAVKGEVLCRDYFMSFRYPEFIDAYHSNIFLAEDRVGSFFLSLGIY